VQSLQELLAELLRLLILQPPTLQLTGMLLQLLPLRLPTLRLL